MADPLRVMIVEDEALVLMQVQWLLEEAGHDVVATAMSAEEAIRRVRETSPDLMLLDLHLAGGSSGIDVARSVPTDCDTCIMFMTANANKLDDEMAGAAAVLSKPFSDSTFSRAISYLEECLNTPPPRSPAPYGMRVFPGFSAKCRG